MRLLKYFRSKSKTRKGGSNRYWESDDSQQYPGFAKVPRKNFARNLPTKVLHNIFAQLCPHALDDSYNSSEESMTEDGCMLCDMRDLAHCALVCRQWYNIAQALLYVPLISLRTAFTNFNHGAISQI